MRKLIKNLELAKGNSATSMVSLVIRQGGMISDTVTMLTNEYATASNIKSRATQKSVQAAITSTLERLKLYHKTPPNGLVIYAGTVKHDDGSEKLTIIDFEPYRPINTKMYMCDKRFHTEVLKELMVEDKRYGFIIFDASSVLFGSLSGNVKSILYRDKTSPPGKCRRGGQSAARLDRIRLEKRNIWVQKAAELATHYFINHDAPNILGLIVAGKAGAKKQLVEHKNFSKLLEKIIIKPLHDVSYGGENGFEQAIRMAESSLSDNILNKEKKILTSLFSEMSKPDGKFCVSTKDVMTALEIGAVKELIVWDELKIWRHEYFINSKTSSVKKKKIIYLKDGVVAMDKIIEEKTEMEEYKLVSSSLLLEWLMSNNCGANLHLVCDRSSEGSQFCNGLEGLGGILQYNVDFSMNDVDVGVSENDEKFDDGDFI
jgi:peptide chain release factor subunit 1